MVRMNNGRDQNNDCRRKETRGPEKTQMQNFRQVKNGRPASIKRTTKRVMFSNLIRQRDEPLYKSSQFIFIIGGRTENIVGEEFR